MWLWLTLRSDNRKSWNTLFRERKEEQESAVQLQMVELNVQIRGSTKISIMKSKIVQWKIVKVLESTILFITLLNDSAFFEGEWGDWSSCSKTCGEVSSWELMHNCDVLWLYFQGSRRRDRCCFSAMTLQKVDNENCANEASHFAQSNKCKLQECPGNSTRFIHSLWMNNKHPLRGFRLRLSDKVS